MIDTFIVGAQGEPRGPVVADAQRNGSSRLG